MWLSFQRNNQQFSDQVLKLSIYRALTSLATEIRWSTFICKGLEHKITDIPVIHCDNKFKLGKHICCSQQLVNLFTKTINHDIFLRLRRKLKIVFSYTSLSDYNIP